MPVTTELKLNIDVDKFALGTVISNFFNWKNYGLLKYDKKTNEILMNEEVIMTIIKLVNPAQKDRKIKLLPVDEWLDKK